MWVVTAIIVFVIVAIIICCAIYPYKEERELRGQLETLNRQQALFELLMRTNEVTRETIEEVRTMYELSNDTR